MSKKNLVSVIIPTFNRAMYIKECIDSVLDQEYRPIELIIVDDESTDDTLVILENIKNECKSDDNFELRILKQKNSGASVARNYGFRESKGDFIQFLDSDDLLLKEKIRESLNAFEMNTAIVYSRAQFFLNTSENLLEKFWGRQLTGNSEDYFEFPWQTMCAIYRRDALLQYGIWNENLSFNDDWEFSLRFVLNKCNIKFINKVQSLYRTHNNNRVGNNLDVAKINSLFDVLNITYQLSLKKGVLNSYLKKRYFSRFSFCFFQYGKMGNFSGKLSVWKKLFKITKPNAILMLPLLLFNKPFFIFILKLKKIEGV